ncbi:Crp/Fnr family transcriptional regulator [Ectothiorhodospira lacustris]|uniref:Crp/Fnr family transcriptional regulator n=1 Tax=Ectothiorhodospira lacustris TaxID=2899127 RepID=UPI003D320C98
MSLPPPSTHRAPAASERRLRDLYRGLSAPDQETLLAFAEFLAGRTPAVPVSIPLPEPIPRPAEETVIRAMKRLSATYPALDKARLLNETSQLMTQHVMQGRGAVEVIDELEAVFARHYQRLCEKPE